MIVYLIHNIVDNKYYVGWCSTSFITRWKSHCYESGRGSSLYLHRAIRKYKPESFTYEILNSVLTEEEAKSLEKLWIITLQSYNPMVGYNMTMGGDGVIPNEMTRKKQSLSQMGKKHSEQTRRLRSEKLKNFIRTPEWKHNHSRNISLALNSLTLEAKIRRKENISKSHMGVPQSPEHRKKNSEGHIGVSNGPCSEERKKKIGDANRGRILGPQSLEHIEKAKAGAKAWRIAKRSLKENQVQN
jgi:group I intron endonuclease